MNAVSTPSSSSSTGESNDHVPSLPESFEGLLIPKMGDGPESLDFFRRQEGEDGGQDPKRKGQCWNDFQF